MKSISYQQFIERAHKKFGDRFDYSKVNYVSYYNNTVIIICPKHGEFEITPASHINSTDGCPSCANERVHRKQKKTTEQFIEEAKEIHGDAYDYSKTVYKSTHDKVTIICPKHGEFTQEAKSHLHGHGCPVCALEYKLRLRSLSTDEFIKRAREIHGDAYDYSKVEYVNETTPVTIGCPIHGWFEQYPVNHLRGAKCPFCQNERNAQVRRKSLDDFIAQAKEVHGDYYDYSKVDYKGCNTPVTIICPKHGEFQQLPVVHLNGHGCHQCNRTSNGEERISLLLNRYDVKFKTLYKIINETKLSDNQRFFLDFYLEDYNLAIEYNGKQHYSPSTRFGGEERFEKQKMRDEALRQTLKKKNIRLLEIPYTEYKHIKEILLKELNISE